jgi:hypothetical protein
MPQCLEQRIESQKAANRWDLVEGSTWGITTNDGEILIYKKK